jgi:hypothetical protein
MERPKEKTFIVHRIIFLVKEDMRIRIGDKVWPGWDISQEGFEPSACGFTVRRSTN